MCRLCALTTLVVLSAAASASEAIEFLVRSEVQVGSGMNHNPFTTLYWHRNESQHIPPGGYSTLTDYGSFYAVPPGNGANTSLWSGRAAAQAGSGYMRVYSEVEALVAGPNNRFTSGHNMAVNGKLAGLVESDGTERVTPFYLTGARAQFEDTITPIAHDPELEGEPGIMQVRVHMQGDASYSQPFYQREFSGRAHSSGHLRIHVGSKAVMESFELEKDHYWDWETKPFEDEALLGGTLTLDAPIVFGDTYDLLVEMWCWTQFAGEPYSVGGDGYALPLGMHTVIADYHNTATWDGVSLFDDEGNPVEGSATVGGEDYTNAFTAPPAPELPPLTPVPEPATLALLAMAIACLATRLRRRR